MQDKHTMDFENDISAKFLSIIVEFANIKKALEISDMDTCELECSACNLFRHQSLQEHDSTYYSDDSMSQSADLMDTYLAPVSGPLRLMDYSAHAGRAAWSTMEPATAAPPVPQDAAAVRLFKNFWESFETSVLYRTDKSTRHPDDSVVSDLADRTYCSIPARTDSAQNVESQPEATCIYQNNPIGNHVPRIPDSREDSCDRFPAENKSYHYESIDLPRRNPCKKQPLLHQFTEFCAKKLAPRANKDVDTGAAPTGKRKSKRLKPRKRSDKEPNLFGPEDEVTEDEQVVPSGDPKCISRLLTQLQTEIAGLKYHGADLTKQMWLLYATFEDFLRARYPETAAGIKRYHVTDDAAYDHDFSRDRTQHSHGDTLTDDTLLDDQMNATSIWIDEVSRLHTNVPETGDWLKPEEECDEWSDDTDRVHKLSESESETDTEIEPDKSGDVVAGSDGDATVTKGNTDCMNISWYTKVKKIDKSSDRHYRTRTPERKYKNKQLQAGVQSVDESFDIVTPVRRPEELFGEWANSKQQKEVPKRQGYTDEGRHSPVTISSGYESDKDGAREREIDSILYGYLPEKKQDDSKIEPSPQYMCMNEPKQEPVQKYNMHKTPHPAAFTQKRKEQRSMEDVSRTDDSEKTVVAETRSPGAMARCKSLDDVLRENGVVFKSSNSPSPNSKKGKRKFSEVRRSMDFIIKDLDSPKKKHEHEGRRTGASDDQSSVVCEPSMTDDQTVPLSDDDEDTASTVYENLPAALYAQVSPPKPEKVYKTPSYIGANPLWVSTPMDDSHRPRIMQSSGKKSSPKQFVKPQPDSSLKSRIRQKIGFLLDEKPSAFTPYKSAFRPYSKFTNQIFTRPGDDQVKLQENSIAELRRGNPTPASPYLCMSQSQSIIEAPTADSVLLNDVTVRIADLDETVTQGQDTIISTMSPEQEEGSPRDSGHGTSCFGSPSQYNFPGYRKLKDSCIVHHDRIDHSDNATTFEDSSHQGSDPVYETIPSDIDTVCKGSSRDWKDTTSQSEHTYCRIGDVPTMLESYSVPEPPPARGHEHSMMTENKNGSPIPKAAEPSFRVLRASEKVQPSDIMTMNKFHTYTVGDVLESFEQYAGHLGNQAKNRNNIYGLMADHHVRRQFSNAMKGDDKEVAALNDPQAAVVKNDSKRSSKYSSQKGPSKYHRQSEKFSQSTENKLNVCNFTPGFSQVPPFEMSGPLYTGGAVRLEAVKKTLSFQDISHMSFQASVTRHLQPHNTRLTSRPSSAPKSGEFQKLQVQSGSSHTYQGLATQSTYSVQQPRPQSCTVDKLSIQHHRYASDCTPTVIDGMQSYNTTMSDVTIDSSCSDLILSPPSAFKGSPRSSAEEAEDEDPVYENIRDMEIMRQNRRRAVEEGRAYRVTPLRRTKSALQIKWSASASESKEIFC